jgi:hypothetical protein
MANGNSKPYFLLVFEKGDTMPTITSAGNNIRDIPKRRRQNNEYYNRKWR